MRNCKNGEYYYGPHRRRWGVWLHRELGDGLSVGEHVCDYDTKEEARREVYRLNNWNYKE